MICSVPQYGRMKWYFLFYFLAENTLYIIKLGRSKLLSLLIFKGGRQTRLDIRAAKPTTCKHHSDLVLKQVTCAS